MPFIDHHLTFKDLKIRPKTSRIVIHHSASADVSAAEIYRWHLANGWSGIGYHYLIRKNGQIELGRPAETIGAHTQGYNEDSIGICLTGNFMQELPTNDQLIALGQLIHEIEKQYGKLEVNRHRELSPTNCPGDRFPWEEFMKQLNENTSNPSPEEWKQTIMNQARKAGLITSGHHPDDPAPKWFVLAIALHTIQTWKNKNIN